MLYKLIMLGLQWKDCILTYWDLLIKVMTKTVMFLIDQFTKSVEIKMAAIPEQSALLTAKKVLVHFIATFGCPLEIHTDQGRNFESKLF